MFRFPGYTFQRLIWNYQVLPSRVSPFGHPRVKGCSAPHRGLSQPSYVLHRLLESRHPPYALKFFDFTCVRFRPARATREHCLFLPATPKRPRSESISSLTYCLKVATGFCFQKTLPISQSFKKVASRRPWRQWMSSKSPTKSKLSFPYNVLPIIYKTIPMSTLYFGAIILTIFMLKKIGWKNNELIIVNY